jgi:hypothetical protein
VQFELAEHYVATRPISPVRPPAPEATKEITAAMRTLKEHDMFVQAPDARERE